jgi:putative transcriptional regulator
MNRLNNRVRVLRAEHSINQTELANAIGVTQKTISSIEVGQYVPSTVIALTIAEYFDVPVEDVFSLIKPKPD